MGRKVRRNEALECPEFKSVHRFARISPPKVRLVLDLVRGMLVNDALNVLRTSPRRGAAFVDKVLTAAIANADDALNDERVEGDFELDALYIHEAVADEGPRFGRWRPRARGMATPVIKRTSHITIKLRPQAGAAS